MSTLLCAASRCRIPGRHTTSCLDDTERRCFGCLPARAADGLRLCLMHTRLLEPDAIEAAALHGELGLALIGSGDAGEVRSSNPQPGLSIREPVVEHRALIRHTLVSWALLVTEERGSSLPWRWTPWELIALPTGAHGPLNRTRMRVADESTAAIGRFLAVNAQWLAAHGAAGEVSGELSSLVARGRSLRQPSGTRVVEIGPCPHQVDDQGCTGTLRALLRTADNLLPSAVACDADEGHCWDSTQWTRLGRTMKVRAA